MCSREVLPFVCVFVFIYLLVCHQHLFFFLKCFSWYFLVLYVRQVTQTCTVLLNSLSYSFCYVDFRTLLFIFKINTDFFWNGIKTIN